MEEKVRWGILGAGGIAHRFARSLAHEPSAELLAISCRNPEKGRAFADTFGVSRIYDQGDAGHLALLQDPDVDAVYIALPHHLHFDWVMQAIDCGKAVLCEKPAMMSAAEMRSVEAFAKAKKVLFMEAMKPRFMPIYPELFRRIRAGEVGTLLSIRTDLCNAVSFEETGGIGATYHTQLESGGALTDTGCYCISWLEEVLTTFGLSPADLQLTSVHAVNKNGVNYYTDASFRAQLLTLRMRTAFDRAFPRQAVLTGTGGTITVLDLHRPVQAEIARIGNAPEVLSIPAEIDDFYGEIHYFSTLLLAGEKESPQMTLASSVRMAEISDRIRAAFTPDGHALELLQQQEDTLVWPHPFRSADALKLGNELARLAEEDPSFDRDVAIRIYRESDGLVLFQYMMDEKAERNYAFMDGKRQVTLATGHSSLYAVLAHTLDENAYPSCFSDPEKYCVSGGSFPIREQNPETGSLPHTATVSVSGLHEGKDHELVVRALSNVLGKPLAVFPYAAV